jgi:hypothetical protein
MGEAVTTFAPLDDAEEAAEPWGVTGPERAGAPKVGEAPSEPAKALIPADGFHDTREVAAAEAANLPTQAGYPLHAAAVMTLQNIREGIAGARSHLDWIEAQLDRAAAIGAGN